MTPQQALNNLKQGLDIATKAGAFANLESAATLLTSLQVIAQQLTTNDSNGTNDNSNSNNNSVA